MSAILSGALLCCAMVFGGKTEAQERTPAPADPAAAVRATQTANPTEAVQPAAETSAAGVDDIAEGAESTETTETTETADTDADPGADAGDESVADPTFDVWEYRVLGNTRLDDRAIESTLYPFLGAARTFEQIDAARQALEAAYREAGYFTVLVTTPEQEIDPRKGIVRLQVTEGEVDRLHVTGARYFSQRRIAEQLPSLQPGKVPTTQGFKDDLTLAAVRSQDRTLQPVAKSGRRPGTVEFEIDVDDRTPFHWAVEANDRFTIGTSRPRISVNASYANLFQREHTIGASVQFTPLEDEVVAYSASYTLRPPRSDRSLVLYFIDNRSDIATLGGDLTLGTGRTYGLRNITPLGTRGRFNHSLTTGADYKDFVDNVDPGGAGGSGDDDQGVLTTAIDYLVLSAVYSGNYRGAPGESRPGALNSFSLGLFGGVRGLANLRDEFEDKRFRAEPNFLYLSGEFSRTTPFTDTLALYTRVKGQVTGAPLVANEQFSLGGAGSVRGYFLAEQLVDYGMLGNLELRYSPALLSERAMFDRVFLRGFADYGSGRIYQPLPEQQSSVTMGSVGVGLQALGGARHRYSLTLDWAYALSDAAVAAPGEPPPGTEAGDSRIHVSVRHDF